MARRAELAPAEPLLCMSEPKPTLMFTTVHESPIGPLRIVVDETGALLRIDFPGHEGRARGKATTAGKGESEDRSRCAHVAAQLDEYFRGERTEFDLALRLEGTPFQQKAWRALQKIPFGKTRSYQEQAKRVGNPAAMRAVGAANGRNRIPIVVPCHRVIGKDGSLTGFGGGVAAKEWLLGHEQRVLGKARTR